MIAWGQSDTVNAHANDNITVYNEDAFISLSGNAVRAEFKTGTFDAYSEAQQTFPAATYTQKDNFLSSTIVGGNLTDTLQFREDINLNDQFYNIAKNSFGALNLYGTGTSQVTLGPSGDIAGIGTLVAGTGSVTVDASAYGTRSVNFDLRKIDAVNSRDLFIGEQVYDVLIGNRFITSLESQLAHSTLYGGKGTDSLQVLQAGKLNSANILTDSAFDPTRMHSVEVLQLSATSLISATEAHPYLYDGNNVILGANAQNEGISTVYGASATVGNVTLDGVGDTITRTKDFTRNITISAGSGDDRIILQTLNRGDSLIGGGNSAVNSLHGGDTLDLQFGSDTIGIDSKLSAAISGFEYLWLHNTGDNNVYLNTLTGGNGFLTVIGGERNDTIDASSYSSLSGVYIYDSIGGNNSLLSGRGNDLIIGGTGSDTIDAGDGNDTVAGGGGVDYIYLGEGANLVQFSKASDLADVNVVYGGTGKDTLAVLGADGVYSDSYFANLTNIDAFKTGAGSNVLTLKDNVLASRVSSVIGGAASDIFYVSYGLLTTTSNITLDGGGSTVVGGADTLAVLESGLTITDAVWAHQIGYSGAYYDKLINFNVFQLAGGNNSVIFGQYAQNYTQFRTIVGGSGSDTFVATLDGVGMTYIGKGGNDSILAGQGNDNFVIEGQIGVALSGVSLSGGNGTDSLTFASDAQTWNDSTLSATPGGQLDKIEVLKTANGNNLITLGTKSNQIGIRSVIGGIDDDSIDASTAAYNSTNVTIAGGGGNDSLLGGGGNDYFKVSTEYDLSTIISLSGNGGTDTLAITSDGQTLSDSDFTKVSSIEVLKTADGNNSLTLGQVAQTAGILSVYGGVGDDTIDASSYTNAVFISGGDGADSIRSGAGNDLFNYSTATGLGHVASLSGGAGSNTLALTSDGQTGGDTLFKNVSQIQTFKTSNGANSITFGASAQNAGIISVISGTGNDTLDASAYTTGITMTGGGGSDSLLSGTGNDLFNFSTRLNLVSADTVAGGLGIDTVAISTDGQQFLDTDFSKLNSIEVFQTGTGSIGAPSSTLSANILTLAGNATKAGITTVIGGSGNDSFNVSSAFFGAASSIIGGAGNDTVTISTDAQTIADAAFTKLSSIEVFQTSNGANSLTLAANAANAGILTVVGGSGNDSFNVSSAFFSAASSIIGGAGNDTVALSTDAQTIADAAFTKLSSIEVFKTANGANSITLGTNASTASIRNVIGGSDADTFDASALASNINITLNGNGGADSLLSGSGADVFLFSTATNLGAAATVNGGSGNDTVALTSNAQTVADAAFAKLSSIEVFQTADGANSLTLASNFTASMIGTVVGGLGNDTIDASALGSNINITLNGNSGADSLLSGGGNDVFLFNTTTDLTTATTVSGGSGTDTVALTLNAQTVTDAAFAKLKLIEVLKTADGNNSLTLATNAAAAGIITVVGGSGNDTINASAFTSGITLNGNGGADSLLSGSGNDAFLFTTAAVLSAAAKVSGGSGTDTVALSSDAQTVADAAFAKLSSIEVFQVANGANTLTLATNATTTGISTVVGGSGNDSFNVTSSFFSNTSTASLLGGSGTDSLALTSDAQTIADTAFTKLSFIEVFQTGNGANSLTLAANAATAGISTIIGGTGNDSFNVTSSFFSNTSTASLLGGSGTDSLALTSDAQTIADTAFTKLSSIEVIKTANGNNSITIGSAYAQKAGITALVGGTGNDTFSAVSYTTSVTLDGGGTAVAADSLTGGQSSDLFILGNAGTKSTYYGTSDGKVGSSSNYAIVTNLATNDKLQLNLNDYNAGKYTLGNFAGNSTRTTTHFGLFDNGMFVGDITTSGGYTVPNTGGLTPDTGAVAFLNPANNHVTYV